MSKLLAFLFAGLCATAALAQPYSHDDWRWQRAHEYRHSYYHGHVCPPGLVLWHGGCAAPGHVRYWHRDDWRRAREARYMRHEQWRREHFG